MRTQPTESPEGFDLMVLLPEELKAKLQPLPPDTFDEDGNEVSGTGPAEDLTFVARFFTPGCGVQAYVTHGQWKTHLIAADGTDGDYEFFGWTFDDIRPQDAEWAFLYLSQLEEMRSGPFGLPLERDRCWEPRRAGDVIAEVEEANRQRLRSLGRVA